MHTTTLKQNIAIAKTCVYHTLIRNKHKTKT